MKLKKILRSGTALYITNLLAIGKSLPIAPVVGGISVLVFLGFIYLARKDSKVKVKTDDQES